MLHWEYRVVGFEPLSNGSIRVSGSDPKERALAPVLYAEGEQGWELVEVWTNPKSVEVSLIFKRPKATSA